jgi:hypothetical protein
MKRNFQGQAFALLVTAGIIFGNTSCSKTEQKNTETAVENSGTEAKQGSEEAYTNFKNWVNDADRDTAYVFDNKKDWNKEISDRETAYNERVTAVDKYSTEYDEARRAEIEEMKTRYNTNWETRKQTYTNYSKGVTWRPEYLTIPAGATDLSSLNATNIRAAYENFVKKVEANKKSYTNDDWKIVDMYWEELDTRKNAIQNELSSKDKMEVAKAKTKYQAMKAASKTGNTAEKVGTDVKDATKAGAEKVGNTAKKVGTDVKEETQEGSSKVGNAAKKAGGAIKDTYKKAEDKVDGTKDKK